MRSYLIIVLIFCIANNPNLYSKMSLDNYKIGAQQNSTLISKENKIIVYGLNITNQGSSYYTIDYFDGNSWSVVPSIFDNDDHTDKLEFKKAKSNIIFGTKSELWLCGETDGFFNWDGKNSKKYFLDDDMKSKREYTSIGMDSSGNIWLTANVILDHKPPYINYYSEIIKYDGNNYTIVADTKDGGSHLGFDDIFVTSDNRILVTSLTIKNNLWMITQEKNVEYITIPTPHNAYDSQRFEQRFASIENIFEDSKGDIWFSMGSNDPIDPGLVVLNNDNTWRVYTEHNNYPLRYTSKGFSNRDSLFKECLAVNEDFNGNIWVGGTGFLNYINEDDMLVTPNIEDFLNQSTFYSRRIITDPGKEAPPSQVQFLNSSDSISIIVSELFGRDWTTQHTMGKIGGTGGRVESMTTTTDGSIWIAFTHIGLLRYQPTITSVETQETTNINLYPNPAKEEINISYDKMINSIEILDLNGKEIISNKNLAPQMEQNIKVDYLHAGTYLIRINDNVYKRFVKE